MEGFTILMPLAMLSLLDPIMQRFHKNYMTNVLDYWVGYWKSNWKAILDCRA